MDNFTLAYVTAALFFTNDESTPQGGKPLDENYDLDDLAKETKEAIKADCHDFQEKYGHLFEGLEERAGHDFWLTRNHHGSGFWDGDWPENGDELTEASQTYPEIDLYVGDDGKIYY